MPVINGHKVACEPCIRGHRSTKCAHHDRVMVPVRKPGRPLSTCPHQPGKPCPCGGVTAAIPRKGKCGCGSNASGAPSTTPSHAPTPIKTEPIGDDAPLSPTKTGFRVSKAVTKPNRKLSYDPSTLERMDLNSLNIIPPYHIPDVTQNGGGSIQTIAPANFVPPPQTASHPNHMAYQPQMSFQPRALPQQPLPHHVNPPSLRTGGVVVGAHLNTSTVTVPTGHDELSPTETATTATNGGASSCCSSNSSAPRHTPTSSAGSISQEPPLLKTGSCCSSQGPPPDAINGAVYTSQIPPADKNPMAQFNTPASLNQQIYSTYIHQPTVYTYPSNYGSYLHPLQPSEWRQTMQTLVAAGYNPANLPQAPLPSQLSPPLPLDTNGEGADPSTSHQCGCGPSCQCIGCVAHPYNEATQEYIRSAMSNQQGFESKHPSVDGLVNGLVNGFMDKNVLPTSNGLSPTIDGASPPSAPTPVDTASPTSNEEMNTFNVNDYFFVTYPMDQMGCAGETTSCPCGDDCQCIGCIIHGNASTEGPAA